VKKRLVHGLCGLFSVLVVSVHGAEPGAGGEPEEGFRILDWGGYNQVVPLADGTSLHLYVAQNTLDEPADGAQQAAIQLRFSFLPRFQCSPLIGIVGTLADDIPPQDRVALMRQFNQIDVSIDDENLLFPALVEVEQKHVYSYFNAPLERRNTLRILVELGSRLRVNLGPQRSEFLSLLGSGKALETALGRCKNHR